MASKQMLETILFVQIVFLFVTGRSARFYTFEYDITIWIAIDFEIATSVLVWFHGGGLASGMAGMYEPHFIMDYQVIFSFQHKIWG